MDKQNSGGKDEKIGEKSYTRKELINYIRKNDRLPGVSNLEYQTWSIKRYE